MGRLKVSEKGMFFIIGFWLFVWLDVICVILMGFNWVINEDLFVGLIYVCFNMSLI